MGPVVGVEEGEVEVGEGGMMVKVKIGRVEGGRRGGRRGGPTPGAVGPSSPSKVIISRNPLRPKLMLPISPGHRVRNGLSSLKSWTSSTTVPTAYVLPAFTGAGLYLKTTSWRLSHSRLVSEPYPVSNKRFNSCDFVSLGCGFPISSRAGLHL